VVEAREEYHENTQENREFSDSNVAIKAIEKEQEKIRKTE
jgi:hypothetical protein